MTEIIPIQRLTTYNLPDAFLKVYRWASQNTAETRQDSIDELSYKYFWPSPASLLLDSLKLSRGQLVALVGLSGVGKSSAQREIAKTLDAFLALNQKENNSGTIPRAVYFKWPGKLEANTSIIADSLELSGIINRKEVYLLCIVEKANSDPAYDDKLYDTIGSLKGKTLDALKEKLRKHGYTDEAFIKKFLTKGEQKELERELVIFALSACHSILIDMRDYGIEDKRAMAGDLAEIQKLWQTIVDRISANNTRISYRDRSNTSVTDLSQQRKLDVPNFVFVLQKELAMSDQGMVTHFFLGKARIIEIVPFSPQELVDHYRAEFGSFYPFKSDRELFVLARISRGIFRRFLRYIKLSQEGYIQQTMNKQPNTLETKMLPAPNLDQAPDQPETGAREQSYKASEICIDYDLISKILDSDEIDADWKMDLERIFHNPRQAMAASEVLRALLEIQGANQSSLLKALRKTKKYNLTSSDASRILSKLEQYGYLRRRRDGPSKIVDINF